MTAMPSVLRVEGLRTHFTTRRGPVEAVAGVDLEVRAGEVLALLGESGCGKSATAMSIMGLIPADSGQVVAGSVHLKGCDLRGLNRRQLDQLRGKDLAMIFQDPMTSLNPVLSIGRQLTETLRRHRSLSAAEARAQAVQLLHEVGIQDPEARLDAYAHQLSGGMCQRVMIAMAISCNPAMLIADEPTTALDVTVQRQVMDLLHGLCRRRNMALLLITHDLGVVARYADRVAVMYLGQIVEQADVSTLLAAPAHPYTAALLRAMPDIDQRCAQLPTIPGSVPDLHERPRGCPFVERCERAAVDCLEQLPELSSPPGPARRHEQQQVRCWHPLSESRP